MAKASSLAQNLAKELECAVCLEEYKEPKVLPCLHSYCKKCLEGLLTKQGAEWRLNCPSCRISVEIPKGEIDSLPVNFFLNNLLCMVSLHGDSHSSNLECDNCDSGDPPVNRCATCCHFLCEFCTAGHRRGRNTKAHRLMSLEEAKEQGPVAVTRPSLCKEHEGEVLKLFCETCDEAICRDCTIVKHREHKYAFVKDAFSESKESVLKILSETKTKASVIKGALDAVSEVKRSVQSHAEQTVQEVLSCFQELTDCLNTRCNELICSVEELKKAKLKSLEIQQEELETALGNVWSSVEFTERALEHGSEVDILNMRKQMSARLQELNSARWQLEPISHDRFKFCPDYQLKQALPSFGDVTDVFTHAGSSTVTMGHGSEGVMYNTLNGQLIEFFITAKESGGEKRTEGGDVFEVEISTEDGETVCNNTVEDCGNGTYSFCFTPIHGNVEYRLSVTLSGCHVRGSPFAWVNKVWNLCTTEGVVCRDVNRDEYRKDCLDQLSFSPVREYIPFDDIQLTENNMKATFLLQHYKNSDSHQTVFGSSSFVSGRHSWKVCISGNFTAGFAFGACGIPQHQYPDSQWTWRSGSKYQSSSKGQQSVITNCVNNDVIEFYLDCYNQTLMMYNQRTTHFDTWRGIRGRVCPMFILCCDGDEVSLPCKLTSSHNLETGYKPLRDNDDGGKVSLPCKLTSSQNLRKGSQPLRDNESTRKAYKTGKVKLTSKYKGWHKGE